MVYNLYIKQSIKNILNQIYRISYIVFATLQKHIYHIIPINGKKFAAGS